MSTQKAEIKGNRYCNNKPLSFGWWPCQVESHKQRQPRQEQSLPESNAWNREPQPGGHALLLVAPTAEHRAPGYIINPLNPSALLFQIRTPRQFYSSGTPNLPPDLPQHQEGWGEGGRQEGEQLRHSHPRPLSYNFPTSLQSRDPSQPFASTLQACGKGELRQLKIPASHLQLYQMHL